MRIKWIVIETTGDMDETLPTWKKRSRIMMETSVFEGNGFLDPRNGSVPPRPAAKKPWSHHHILKQMKPMEILPWTSRATSWGSVWLDPKNIPKIKYLNSGDVVWCLGLLTPHVVFLYRIRGPFFFGSRFRGHVEAGCSLRVLPPAIWPRSGD